MDAILGILSNIFDADQMDVIFADLTSSFGSFGDFDISSLTGMAGTISELISGFQA